VRTRLGGGPAARRKLQKILGLMPELNVIPSRLPFAKSTAKGPPFSIRGVPATAAAAALMNSRRLIWAIGGLPDPPAGPHCHRGPRQFFVVY
jgi:hypothetical protein